MNETLLDKIQDVFRKVFENPDLGIYPDTTANDITGWDSLTHMTLISELESHFDITFTYEQVNKFNNVGDMIDLISQKIN
jgi:acyl carrier protein